jgi:protein disulfide-isomerase A1
VEKREQTHSDASRRGHHHALSLRKYDLFVAHNYVPFRMQIYAPWCGHCQSLEPTYNKLAKHLHGIDSLVIAKMDGTGNEHPRAKVCIAAFDG